MKVINHNSSVTETQENSEDVFVFPASFGQKRLWFLDQLQPGNSAYNECAAINCRGKLNTVALEQSLNEIVRRHEVLRTYFSIAKGEPVQVILPYLTLKLPVTDLRSISGTEQEVRVKQIIEQETQKPFNLKQAPLLRFSLLQLTENEYVFILVLHHIIHDGWSMGLIFREIETLYEAFINNQPSPLPELSIQYADFTIHQNNYLQGEALEKLLNYWQKQLKKLSVLALPTDKPRPTIETYRGATQTLVLPKKLCNAIKTLSQQQGVTLFMTLLAAFKILLYRYTQQQDIVVGTPVAGRNLTQTENLIGFFVDNLVLRSNLEGNPSFLELLSQVRKVALGAYAHQDMPFEKLVEVLKPERDLGRSPLFQVMFVLLNTPLSKMKLSGVTLEARPIEKKISKLDLTLFMEEISPEGICTLERNTGLLDPNKCGMIAAFEYNTDLFDAETIERMAQHFQTLLTGIVANPNFSISELPLLTEAEHHQLLVEWNNTAVEYPTEQCIHQLFEAQVEKTPDAIAVEFEGEQLTYQQLNAKANQLAHYLHNLGLKPETLVGICVERSLEMLVGLLGVLKAGGAYVPLDPSYPRERLAYMLEDAAVSVLLTGESILENLPEHSARVVCLDSNWDAIATYSIDKINSGVTSDNLAYVIYTSGSTGKPKGVQICHYSVVNFLVSMNSYLGLTPEDTLSAITTICFDIAALELYIPLTVGAKIAIVSRQIATDGNQLLDYLQKSPTTVMQGTPATWKMLLNSGLSEQNLGIKILCGGEALSIQLANQLKNSGTELWNLYGPTEATIWSAIYSVNDRSKLKESGKVTTPIGLPIANTKIYILDSKNQPVPIGVPGELHISGTGLARGYLNRPELTAEKFISFGGKRLYKTGDLARYLPDGNIEYLGRIDNQVKLRGFRIELGEIESVLSNHPQIKQAVVIAREDIPGNKRLVAYIVISDESLSNKELREFTKQKLPEYMVPSAFVTLESLPLTPNSKIDRKALPAPDGVLREHEYVAPRSQSEEIIANIFANVLAIQKVGIHDNFFDLGGHSLLTTQLISRLRETFAVEISIREVFESPTVAELDQTLKQLHTTNRRSILPSIQPRTDKEQLPLSWGQERLWFLNQLEGPSSTYNMSGAFRVSGNLNINALQLALSEILRRHEVLRTSFPTQNSKPTQVINPQTNININLVDLQQLELTGDETIVLREAQKEATTPFNLETAPLVRCSLLQLSTTESVLLLTMHHIVSDGWSIGLFIQELSTLYQAFAQGKSSPLPELPIQYADFAVWQRQYLSGEVLLIQLNYWKQNLANAPELLQLPTDRPRPTAQTYQGTTQSWTLDTELTQKLQNLSRQNGTTLFMTLLAGFATLLYRYSGQSDILIGSPIANRNRSEIESLIGFFVNTLVLRTAFVDNPSFEELLGQVRETTLKAYQHQDVPFEQVVEALQPQRSLSHSPLFQVMFILQNAPMGEVELPGVSLSVIQSQRTIAKFDLTLSMSETESGLVGEWEYNTDLFDSSTIERMAGYFQNLLLAMVENPAQKINELSLLSAEEHHQLLVEWNDTAVEYPKDKCIHQLFEAQVEKTPDAVAVVFEGEQLTYSKLNQSANQLAHYLQSLGVKPETLVGICLERSVEMVVGLLGILKAGGAYVPIDPTYPTERLSYMLEDAAVPVLLTTESVLEHLPENSAQVVCLDSNWDTIANHSTENFQSSVTQENLAYTIYTSGSTGKPKGCMNTHKGIYNRLLWMQDTYQLTVQERILQKTPFSFDVSVWEFFWPLLTGATLVVAPPEIHKDNEALINLITQQQITTIHFVPSMLSVFLQGSKIEECNSLKRVICSGEALSYQLQKQFQEKLKCELHNLYGPTEAAIDVTFIDCGTNKYRGIVPIGRPIANTQLYILDKNNQSVPIGVAGELHIGGAGLARGYLNRPELTAERFIPNPFDNNNSKLYKTGDLVRYLPDGNIEYIGRIDNQVKLRGFRIELGEIESVLSSHPQIQQTVVVCREDVPGNQKLVAYIVTSEQGLNSSELRPYLQSKLPEYMIPSAFVLLETLPLTPNGKIDRKALPAPDIELTRSHEYVPPQTETEKHIATVLQEVLQLEKVSIYDNFFELGANSLILVKVNSKLREILSIELPLIDMFTYPNIKTLSQHIANINTPKPLPEVPQLERNQIKSSIKKRRQLRQKH